MSADIKIKLIAIASHTAAIVFSRQCFSNDKTEIWQHDSTRFMEALDTMLVLLAAENM